MVDSKGLEMWEVTKGEGAQTIVGEVEGREGGWEGSNSNHR